MNVDDKLSLFFSLFLFQYRTTPNCPTEQSSADLFLHRHLRKRLDFLKLSNKATVRRKQYQQKDCHDINATDRSFNVDDPVYLRSSVAGDHIWIPALVMR